MKQQEPEYFQDKYENKCAKCSSCWSHRLKRVLFSLLWSHQEAVGFDTKTLRFAERL